MKSVEELEQVLVAPSDELIQDMARLSGDVMILGAGGKMGPTLAVLARNAITAAGKDFKVYAVSRFSDESVRRKLERHGITVISADLLDERQLAALPEVENVIYMVGYKFGSTGNEHLLWAMNTYLPGRVAEHFRNSRIVSFSTGNIYHLSPVAWGGATESTPPQPYGEYAQSCLGRERIFDYFSRKYQMPVLHFRLNYAVDLRYGVLVDVAQSVFEGRPIDLSMGHVNVIWQGDANERALRALLHCSTPPKVVNVTGPETVSIRWVAQVFGKNFGKEPIFINEESETALISNASLSQQLFGYPRVTLGQMIDWVTEWIQNGLPLLGKPTHFQERQGRF
ncbi:NAD-dependent epimerase/dehydratase family protein [Kyrpidia tusciae]|uniref:NAD-dependent epimerase/dehydratase n=1 Tax=Kyrpidia tusciae (strain DSM 2912 / NBRC 15312 / T2) TaxID=562970 RepID=D5WWD1_KYRT2|nr:NAD-dependent epimerase/dehydratase family protein [Kyrpidia tusciae]ADG07696.1 NAD-dependent epimerase/dehydratase [Kyrpidia tusciae DSM 2912]